MTDEIIDRIQIIAKWGMRIRREPIITADNIIGKAHRGTIHDVVEYQESGSYEWARLLHGGWVAAAPRFVYRLPASYSISHQFSFAAWPTDYVYYPGSKKLAVNQAFGKNQHIYSRYGLPGHEGVDLYAPHGSNIYAVSDGTVIRVGDERVPKRDGGHNYGVRVYLEHNGGYTSVYAHLDRRLVDVGDKVSADTLIGYADNTGNSRGSHLHFTLKHVAGQEGWPYNIIDPMPFLYEFVRTRR